MDGSPVPLAMSTDCCCGCGCLWGKAATVKLEISNAHKMRSTLDEEQKSYIRSPQTHSNTSACNQELQVCKAFRYPLVPVPTAAGISGTRRALTTPN
eukprot:528222-Pleurochrysis_carterae.AAC.1